MHIWCSCKTPNTSQHSQPYQPGPGHGQAGQVRALQGFTGALGLHTVAIYMHALGIHQGHLSIWLAELELADRHLQAAAITASRLGCHSVAHEILKSLPKTTFRDHDRCHWHPSHCSAAAQCFRHQDHERQGCCSARLHDRSVVWYPQRHASPPIELLHGLLLCSELCLLPLFEICL